MAAVGEAQQTLGRDRSSFARQRDIDEFVETLGRYENGEISPDDWRRFRLLRGTYGQRQDGVQMMRIKIPQGIVTGQQMRALADVATKYSRGFSHITTRQNIQYHFVLLKDAELAMRDLADVGMTTREACGNSVRNITACPYAGVAHDEVFDVTPYAEAHDPIFPRSSAGRCAAAQVQDCVRRLPERSRPGFHSRPRVVRAHRRWKARLPPDDRRRHVHSSDLRLLAVRVPARRADARSGRGDRARLPPVRRLQAPPAQPDEVPHQGSRMGGLASEIRRGAGRGAQGRGRAVRRERRGDRGRRGSDVGPARRRRHSTR